MVGVHCVNSYNSKNDHQTQAYHKTQVTGLLRWAMVLGSFQCRGVLLLLHIVGQGSSVLAAGAGWVSYSFYIFHLLSLSNVLSFGDGLT